MTRYFLLILLSLVLTIGVGCKSLPDKKTVKTEESVSRQWEWEISQPSKITKDEEEIEKVVFHNPYNFYKQSPKFTFEA